MSISKAAIEATAECMWERSLARLATGESWAEVRGGTRDGWLLDAAAALEAAAPHMLAGAWDRGYEKGALSQFEEPNNPYRRSP